MALGRSRYMHGTGPLPWGQTGERLQVPVAQWIRAAASEAAGRRFESCRER